MAAESMYVLRRPTALWLSLALVGAALTPTVVHTFWFSGADAGSHWFISTLALAAIVGVVLPWTLITRNSEFTASGIILHFAFMLVAGYFFALIPIAIDYYVHGFASAFGSVVGWSVALIVLSWLGRRRPARWMFVVGAYLGLVVLIALKNFAGVSTLQQFAEKLMESTTLGYALAPLGFAIFGVIYGLPSAIVFGVIAYRRAPAAATS
jgi:hypothetical protein